MPKKQNMLTQIRLPISIRCDTCGNHICQGSCLDSWKEPVVGETYMGIERFRIYFDCSKCSAKITLKAYPNDPNLVVESGATRTVEYEKREEEAQEIGNGIKSLQLDDINSSSIKSGHATVSVDAMLEASAAKKSEDFVRRIEDGDSEDETEMEMEILRMREMIRGRPLLQKFEDFVHRIEDGDSEDKTEMEILRMREMIRGRPLLQKFKDFIHWIEDVDSEDETEMEILRKREMIRGRPFSQKSKDFVRRIEDGDSEDETEMEILRMREMIRSSSQKSKDLVRRIEDGDCEDETEMEILRMREMIRGRPDSTSCSL